MKKSYKIEVDCANCADQMELCASKIDGVKNVSVNFMSLRMIVEFEEGFNNDEVMKNVLKSCKKVEKDCNILF